MITDNGQGSRATGERGLDTAPDIAGVQEACEDARASAARVREMVGRVIVGQEEVVEQVLIALLAGGHVLLEGVPGLAKTLLVQTLGRVLSLSFAKIQFTPDLMPTDMTGTSIVIRDPVTGQRSFNFRPGPLFHHIILADEINRATPKSQSALLEAMEERSVTVDGRTRMLERPFLILATQNPIEQEGTWPLPEAQLDRFFFKIHVPGVSRDELNRIVDRTTGVDAPALETVLDAAGLCALQDLVRRIVIAPEVQDYAVRLVIATRPGSRFSLSSQARYIAVGASPRGAQVLILGAKVKALLNGRYAVSFGDIKAVATAALRHRIIRSFEAEAEDVRTEDMIAELLQHLPHDPGDLP